MRLDIFLQKQFEGKHTRSQITNAIKAGLALVNGVVTRKCGHDIGSEDKVVCTFPEKQDTDERAQDIALDIVYEDENLLVVNKPRGMVTHPGVGNRSGTLMNGLLYLQKNTDINRAGIVHRLDMNTAGLLIVAKDVATQAKLTSMLQRREIKREYIGIVEGNLTGSGVINKNIVRHPNKRTLFTTCPVGKGRTAITHYAVEKNFGRYSLVRFKLETGRTHQIRVHIKSLGHPLVGDPEYNPKGGDGQLLEAVRVAFVHPKTGKQIDIQIKPTEKLTMFIKKIVFSTNNHCNKRSR